jgi:hypothetical protein
MPSILILSYSYSCKIFGLNLMTHDFALICFAGVARMDETDFHPSHALFLKV